MSDCKSQATHKSAVKGTKGRQMKEKYFSVDGWITAWDEPRIQLEDRRTGRRHILTLPQVRGLMADILAEIERLADSRTEETDNDSN